jgi:hypothetical protein
MNNVNQAKRPCANSIRLPNKPLEWTAPSILSYVATALWPATQGQRYAYLSQPCQMADLTPFEKRKLERALGMRSGYVLNFNNKTFCEFFLDCCGIDIYNEKYNFSSGSKANRMRAFWELESNYLVAEVLDTLFSEWLEFKRYVSPETPPEECLLIVKRLKDNTAVPDIDAVSPNIDDESFEALAASIRDLVAQNKPVLGLDRLHTFVVKYFRVLCEKRGIDAGREKPLHSLVGGYVKSLKAQGLIESEMTERILKSSISIMEAFNRVRNEQSFAHDNNVLNYAESMLIFGHVSSSIRFIKALEEKTEASSETN